MRLFDAHCHLQDERFASRTAEVVTAARAAGIDALVCCGAEEGDWDTVDALADRFHGFIVPSFGLHPWYARSRSPRWQQRLEAMLAHHPEAGVGEIGLDHVIEPRNDEEQFTVFVEQLRLARKLRRAASIHCRRAWDSLLAALTEVGGLPCGFVVHSFSGSTEMMQEVVARGGSISFSGTLTRSHNKRARAVADAVPADRMLIETDAPDLTPIAKDPATGRSAPATEGPNEPRCLPHVLRALADIRQADEADLASLTWENAARLFGEPVRTEARV